MGDASLCIEADFAVLRVFDVTPTLTFSRVSRSPASVLRRHAFSAPGRFRAGGDVAESGFTV
jgi:hypothetical protein